MQAVHEAAVLSAPRPNGAAALIEEVYRHRGKEPPVDRISVEMAEHYWWIDSRKAHDELGFVARDPQLTLVDTVAYLRRGVDSDL